ncbi:hypothetical protein [Myxosarcina sp. GI1]|uniref:hypothetical protein n=1 Tax=Myxosarcina sp. GI1 TaxID=1541065 RepID=UPI000564D42C|nr:hypothetical protein [Myxosarcina sp. GI1]
MKPKAVGLRISQELWEKISWYGRDKFPKENSESQEFDITATLIELINKGLGNDNTESFKPQDVEQIVEHKFNERFNNLLNDDDFIKAIASKSLA